MRHAAAPRVYVSILRKRSAARSSSYRGPRPDQLRRVVLHSLAAAAPHVRGDVAVVVTDDETIRRLNRRYRDKDVSTDVLAFPLGDGLATGQPFGDVVISWETARRQARDYDAALSEEMCRLLIHGTLHLCGYDHHERRQAARMHGLARRLLRELTTSMPALKRRAATHA